MLNKGRESLIFTGNYRYYNEQYRPLTNSNGNQRAYIFWQEPMHGKGTNWHFWKLLVQINLFICSVLSEFTHVDKSVLKAYVSDIGTLQIRSTLCERTCRSGSTLFIIRLASYRTQFIGLRQSNIFLHEFHVNHNNNTTGPFILTLVSRLIDKYKFGRK